MTVTVAVCETPAAIAAIVTTCDPVGAVELLPPEDPPPHPAIPATPHTASRSSNTEELRRLLRLPPTNVRPKMPSGANNANTKFPRGPEFIDAVVAATEMVSVTWMAVVPIAVALEVEGEQVT